MKPGAFSRSVFRLFAAAWLVSTLIPAPVLANHSTPSANSFLSACYLNPNTGRFWTMDSFEGYQGVPLSLHKYVYAHVNPVMGIDPSGHLLEDVLATFTISTDMRQRDARSKTATGRQIAARIAGRGTTGWAWAIGGLSLGAAYLLEDSELGMEIGLSLELNPTGSQWAYENYKCDEFAKEAVEYFVRRGDQPKLIVYRSRSRRTVGDNIFAAPGFGRFGGQNISVTGLHMGVLVNGRVYDNNIPFGVSRTAWETGYLVTSWPEYVEMTIGLAAFPGVGIGDIMVK